MQNYIVSLENYIQNWYLTLVILVVKIWLIIFRNTVLPNTFFIINVNFKLFCNKYVKCAKILYCHYMVC